MIIPTQRDIDAWKLEAENAPVELGRFNWQQAVLSLIADCDIRYAELVSKLNKDVYVLQKAMMDIWHLTDDANVKAAVEKAMAATGMPRKQ